jgi:hypothetical protein
MVTGGSVEKHVASVFDKLGLSPDEAGNRRVLAVLRYLNSSTPPSDQYDKDDLDGIRPRSFQWPPPQPWQPWPPQLWPPPPLLSPPPPQPPGPLEPLLTLLLTLPRYLLLR